MHLEAHEVLPALLEALHIARPVLVGHSDGATIALLHAARHELAACVAIAPHVFVEKMSLHAIDQARQLYEAAPESPDGLRQRLARHHRDVDNAFWQWNDVWLSAAFRSFDIREELGSIKAPLLLIQGVNDEYGSMEQLGAIQKEVPHAKRVAMERCGHSPHRDQPDQLLGVVQSFLVNVK